MFSATFPAKIQQLSQEFMRPYVFLAVGRVGSTCSDVSQSFEWVEERQKLNRLWQEVASTNGAALGPDGATGEASSLTLVFVETKRGADSLEMQLQARGLRVCSIHGDKSQSQRESALRAFKQARIRCLVATDVASRGLDIPRVSLVINYDLPSNLDDYVHRIGRTGRVGNVGRALSFFNERNYNIARPLKKLLQENNQELPHWLHQAAHRRGYGSGSGPGGSRAPYGYGHHQSNSYRQGGKGRARWTNDANGYHGGGGAGGSGGGSFGAYDVRQGFWNQAAPAGMRSAVPLTPVGAMRGAEYPEGYTGARREGRSDGPPSSAPSMAGQAEALALDSMSLRSRTESASNPSSGSLSTYTDSTSSDAQQPVAPETQTNAKDPSAHNAGLVAMPQAQFGQIQQQYGYVSQDVLAQQQAALLQQMYMHQLQGNLAQGFHPQGLNLSQQTAQQMYSGYLSQASHQQLQPQHQQQHQPHQLYHPGAYPMQQVPAMQSYAQAQGDGASVAAAAATAAAPLPANQTSGEAG